MIRRETWIILGIFVLALAGLFLWQRYGKTDAAEETPEVSDAGSMLFDLEAATVRSVRIERVGDQVVELQRDSAGAWQVSFPANFPADSEALEGTLSQLGSVSVVEKMENAPDLAAMGLTDPDYRLLLTLDTGRQIVTEVGNQTPTGSGYYVLSSDRNVYIVNTFSLDPILELIDNLPRRPTETPAEMPLTSETPFGPAGDATPAGTP